VPASTDEPQLHLTVLELAREPNHAAFTTFLPSGLPQTHMTWVSTDGEHLLINTEVHRQKFRNVQRDPRVTVMIRDGKRPLPLRRGARRSP
jgi:hypothetical protein